MKYSFLPRVIWKTFAGSFEKHLFIVADEEPVGIMKKAYKEYRRILQSVPEFDRSDSFLVNLLSAAMLASVYLQIEQKPSLEKVTAFYHRSMTENPLMRLFLKKNHRYDVRAQAKVAWQAKQSQLRTNPYTWRFRYKEGITLNTYTTYFETCGICYLFKQLGIEEIIPAMCSYDYDMARMEGSVFTREHTLAEGGPCCDCHYEKQDKDRRPEK